MAKIIELKGYKSVVAFTTFTKLMYGLSLTRWELDYDKFFERFSKSEGEERLKYLKDAIDLIDLTEDEVLSFACFELDANSVPYSVESIRGLDMGDIRKLLLKVMVRIDKLDVFF